MLLVSSFLTYCFVSVVQEGVPDFWFGISALLLLAVVWAMTLGLFASCFSGQTIQRASSILWKIGEVGLICFLLSAGLRSVVAPGKEDPPVARGGETFLVLLLGYCAVGVFLFLTAKRSSSGDKSTNLSPYEVSLMWPVLLLGRAPLLGLLLFGAVGGLTFLGERIGAWWDHPLLGALAGVCIFASMIVGIGMSCGLGKDSDEDLTK